MKERTFGQTVADQVMDAITIEPQWCICSMVPQQHKWDMVIGDQVIHCELQGTRTVILSYGGGQAHLVSMLSMTPSELRFKVLTRAMELIYQHRQRNQVRVDKNDQLIYDEDMIGDPIPVFHPELDISLCSNPTMGLI